MRNNNNNNNEVNRQNFLEVLQNNDCREIIANCVDGDNLANSFVRAGARKHVDIMQAFLDHGMNIDVKNRNGWTPLMNASYYRHKDIVQLLLDHNADIDLKNNEGETAPDWAKTDEIKEMIQNHVNTSYVLK